MTVDFQQELPAPKIPTETVFYLRQLWMYNVGIHICNDNSAVMYMWPENIASRGSCEIISCLLKVLLNPTLIHNKRKVWIFSDSYSGENKNMIIFTLLCSG